MSEKPAEGFDEAGDESFEETDSESVEDIAPETIRNATTTRRRIEDYLDERQIKHLIDDYDDLDNDKPRKK
jgi:hypothetical protein